MEQLQFVNDMHARNENGQRNYLQLLHLVCRAIPASILLNSWPPEANPRQHSVQNKFLDMELAMIWRRKGLRLFTKQPFNSSDQCRLLSMHNNGCHAKMHELYWRLSLPCLTAIGYILWASPTNWWRVATVCSAYSWSARGYKCRNMFLIAQELFIVGA